MNGNFGRPNKQGGTWSQGGPGNKPGGSFGPKNIPGQSKLGGQGPVRNQQRNNNSRGPHMDGMKQPQREEHMLANKLKELTGPLLDLPAIEQTEVKFNGCSRLYIGNLTNDVTEEEIQALFSQFGKTSELFLNKEKNFGFIKMEYRVNAEKAKRELDGKMRNGRNIRVRFAPRNSAIHVKNLPPFVSNELLYRSFEIFGKIERAFIRVDLRGKPLGEGIVEFARKPSALAAIRNCTEKCFFLTTSLRPVIVENLEEPDEFDGYPEKNLPKKHPEFMRAREVGPRFAEPGSFEHEYGTRWKQLHELHRQKEDALKKELASVEEKLEAQMQFAKYEDETELLREQLRQREEDRERQKRSWEMAVERAAEERRGAGCLQLLRQEEELSQRMRLQDDELRRRQQENTLFVQAQRLNSMLDRQEQGMFDQQPMAQRLNSMLDRQEQGMFDQQPMAQRLNSMLDRQEQGMFDQQPMAQRLNSMLDRQEQGMFDQQPMAQRHNSMLDRQEQGMFDQQPMAQRLNSMLDRQEQGMFDQQPMNQTLSSLAVSTDQKKYIDIQYIDEKETGCEIKIDVEELKEEPIEYKPPLDIEFDDYKESIEYNDILDNKDTIIDDIKEELIETNDYGNFDTFKEESDTSNNKKHRKGKKKYRVIYMNEASNKNIDIFQNQTLSCLAVSTDQKKYIDIQYIDEKETGCEIKIDVEELKEEPIEYKPPLDIEFDDYKESIECNDILDNKDTIIDDIKEELIETNDYGNFDTFKEESDTSNNKKHRKGKKKYRVIYMNEASNNPMYTKITIDDTERGYWLEQERKGRNYRLMAYKCELCISGFAKEKYYMKHMETFHSKTRGEFTCDLCKVHLRSKGRLNLHKREHYTKYACNVCKYQCYNDHQIRTHLDCVHKRAVECLKCGLRFEQFPHFHDHYRKLHLKVVCDYCGQSFTKKKRLIKHIRPIVSSRTTSACTRASGPSLERSVPLRLPSDRHWCRTRGLYTRF